MSIKYSIIIPVYNEEEIIENTIDKLYLFMKEVNSPFEIIVANDGSFDNTLKLVEKKKQEILELKIVSNTINFGRGSILNRAFSKAKGEIQIYIDADLAIDLNLFPKLMKAMEEGIDIAIGSKHLKDSEVEYPFLRRFFSKSYAFLSSNIFGSDIRDYQCGFKAFKKEVIWDMLPYIKNKDWSWDTEILVKSLWRGYKIKELPAKVINIYKRESKVHLFRDIKNMGLNLLALWKEKKKFKR